jgi:tRNA(Ile)-lysidine synthase
LQGRRTRTLKKILQDANIAPWLRDRVPLLYCNDELVCIPGIGICEGWQAGINEPGWQVIWVPPDAAPER